MARPRIMYQKIMKLLEEKGPLSLPKLHEALPEYSRKNLTDTLAQARGIGEGEVRTVYIKDYERQDGKGGMPSPIIAIGNLPDAKRPKGDPLASWRKYNAKPESVAKRHNYNQRRRQRTRLEKTVGPRVFQMMAKPVKPVVLPAVRVVQHVLEDDLEFA
jgi:hypothetical protein